MLLYLIYFHSYILLIKPLISTLLPYSPSSFLFTLFL